MIGAFVHDKHESRLQQLEQSIRFYCRTNKQTPGMVWLSSRTLTGDRLFRGTSETLSLARELAAAGHIGRVTARGAGRTLYWLPSTKKWLVLRELRREDMPHAAIVQAIGFYALRERLASAENVTDATRQQSLGLTSFGTEAEKGTPAKPAPRARAPSGPQHPRQTPSEVLSTPPSDGRLSSHGLSRALSKRLVDGQISEALTRMRRHVQPKPDG
jgi:hypothetical protein